MVPDLLAPDLKLVFCGYNPSLRSAYGGHHYAHPANRFWRVLHAAGITDRLYKPEEDAALLDLGIGFTNLCPRPTRRADELTREEIRSGATDLRAMLERHKPSAVAYTGIGVYKWFRATSKVFGACRRIRPSPEPRTWSCRRHRASIVCAWRS